ncbi:carbohydrate porin [Candidatus Riflebacteria bacterium]
MTKLFFTASLLLTLLIPVNIYGGEGQDGLKRVWSVEGENKVKTIYDNEGKLVSIQAWNRKTGKAIPVLQLLGGRMQEKNTETLADMQQRLMNMERLFVEQNQVIDEQKLLLLEQARIINQFKPEQVAVKDAKKEEPGEEKKEGWYDKVDIAVSGTAVAQTVLDSKRAYNPQRNLTDVNGKFGLEIQWADSTRGLAYANFEAGSGNGLDVHLANLSALNDTPDSDPNLHLKEFWYEYHTSKDLQQGTPSYERFGPWWKRDEPPRKFEQGHLSLKVGKVDLSSEFDNNNIANDSAGQFISYPFVKNPAIEYPADNGPGVRVKYGLSEDFELALAYSDADGAFDDAFEHPFIIGQLQFCNSEKSRPGNYRLYFWQNNKNHTKILDGTRVREEGSGFGLSADQELNDTWKAFVRYGAQDEDVYAVDETFSFGFEYSGRLFGNSERPLGLAYGINKLGSDQKAQNRGNGINSGDESLFELYYFLRNKGNLGLSAHLQWVDNPNGMKANGDAWIFGTRMQLDF